VLNTGGPVLTPWAGQVKGIIEAWYPGQEAGNALARVLYGDVDPGVDKTVTFPEGVMVGYRHYDANAIEPQFPFGHGLSYTTFSYSGLKASSKAVQVTVTNTGDRTGVAVPQLYIGMPSPGVDVRQPPKQLKGYTKVTLAPGASTTVTFPLSSRPFAYWNEEAKAWKVTDGCYTVMVGPSSRKVTQKGTLGTCQ